MKRVIPLFILLIIGLAVVLYMQLKDQAGEKTRASRGSATIEGTEVSAVAGLPARIVAIHVREGDKVEAGAVLVELDCAAPDAALAQAEQAVVAAQTAADAATLGVGLAEQRVTSAERQTDAAKASARASRSQRAPVMVKEAAARRAVGRLAAFEASGGAAEQDIDRAKSEVAALKKQLRTLSAGARAADKQADAVAESVNAAGIGVLLAEAKVTSANAQVKLAEAARARAAVVVRDCTIIAPLSGSITQRNYEPGERVMPGARVLTVVDTAEVRATFFLPNAELANAVPGRAVEVVADAMADTVIAGTIIRVGTQAEFTPRNVQTRDDRDRLVYAVEVSIPNADGTLRPGMPVEIEIPGTEIE